LPLSQWRRWFARAALTVMVVASGLRRIPSAGVRWVVGRDVGSLNREPGSYGPGVVAGLVGLRPG